MASCNGFLYKVHTKARSSLSPSLFLSSSAFPSRPASCWLALDPPPRRSLLVFRRNVNDSDSLAGCDAGIHLSKTELWWAVSVWVCVCLSGCVRVTSLPSQSARRGWETPTGQLFGIPDTPSFHCRPSSCGGVQLSGHQLLGRWLQVDSEYSKSEETNRGRCTWPVLSQKHVFPGSGASLCVQQIVLLMVDCFIVPVGTLCYSPVFSWLGSDSRGRKLMKCTSGAPWCIMRGCRKAWTGRVINEMPEYWTRARLSSGWCHRLERHNSSHLSDWTQQMAHIWTDSREAFQRWGLWGLALSSDIQCW